MDIEKIQVKDNIRKDLGDLRELVASIKEIGIIEPLIIDQDCTLIAGHRRLAAAKAAGLKTVPTVVHDGGGFEVAMAENLQRKELTPIEEAEAYAEHVKKKGSVEVLARCLGKKPEYVERRLDLLKAEPEVQKALVAGKIQLGHAVILSHMGQPAQLKELKHIMGEKLSVASFADNMKERWNETSLHLEDARFDKANCEGCPHNGGQQAILAETGANLKGVCLNPDCFKIKTREFVKAETEKLEAKGMTVLSQDKMEKIERDPDYSDRKRPVRLGEYSRELKDVLDNHRLEKEPELFAVGFNLEHGKLERRIYCMNMAKLRARPESAGPEKSEKQLELSRGEKLDRRLDEFAHTLLVETSQELLRADTMEPQLDKPVKVLVLYELWKKAGESAEKIIEEEAKGIYPDKCCLGAATLKKLYALPEKTLDRIIARTASAWLGQRDMPELVLIAPSLGFEAKKHFALSEEFLELHTIDQLKKLAKELDVDVEGENSKGKLISVLLAAKTKGKVPKSVAKALEGKHENID